jgi:hypothetical protein
MKRKKERKKGGKNERKNVKEIRNIKKKEEINIEKYE